MDFASPWMLLLLLLLPLMAWWSWRQKGTAAVTFSSLRHIRNTPGSWRLKLRPLLGLLRWLCVAFLIIGLARPRKSTVIEEISSEGVAIEIVLDLSYSMSAIMQEHGEKFSRMDAAKQILMEFIQGNKKDLKGRNSDLVGLITFAGEAETVCPMLLGHSALIHILDQTNHVSLENDKGTALGDGIALAAARLKKAEEEYLRQQSRLKNNDISSQNKAKDYFEIKNKVMLILTDGKDKSRGIPPEQAIALAQQWGISIYAIGFGSSEDMLFTGNDMFGRPRYRRMSEDDIDENILKYAAKETGGFYGRATDTTSLRDIIHEIDQKEKTEVKSVQYTEYSERFNWWTWPALGLLLLEIVLSCTLFRKIP